MTQQSILIADDDKDLVLGLAARCRQLGLKVHTANDVLTALGLANEQRPDLICLDVDMPSGSGLSVCELLGTNHELSSVPVIVVTGSKDDETVRRCHKLCAYYVLKCPDIWQRVEPLVRELLNLPATDGGETPVGGKSIFSAVESEPVGGVPAATDEDLSAPSIDKLRDDTSKLAQSNGQLIDAVFEMLGADEDFLNKDTIPQPAQQTEPWVLCIDDDADYSNAMKMRLEYRGIKVARAFAGMEGYRKAFSNRADAILLDYSMPNGQGDYILGRLKDNPVTKNIPVIVVTGQKDKTLERKMLNLGAAAFMNKPVDFDRLFKELSRVIDSLNRSHPTLV